jgi:hypothetical protein
LGISDLEISDLGGRKVIPGRHSNLLSPVSGSFQLGKNKKARIRMNHGFFYWTGDF